MFIRAGAPKNKNRPRGCPTQPVRDSLLSRHWRAARQWASGITASELACNLHPGVRPARASPGGPAGGRLFLRPCSLVAPAPPQAILLQVQGLTLDATRLPGPGLGRPSCIARVRRKCRHGAARVPNGTRSSGRGLQSFISSLLEGGELEAPLGDRRALDYVFSVTREELRTAGTGGNGVKRQ